MNSSAARRRSWIVWTILSCLLVIPAAVARAQDYADVSAALNVTALQPGKPAVLAIVLDVKPGYHAQSHAPLSENLIKTEVMLDESPAIEHDAAVYPPGRVESYPQLGKLSVYTGKTILYVPLRVKPNAPLGPTQIKGTVTYQVCDDKACFAPQDTPFSIDTNIVGAGETVAPNRPELFADFKAAPTTGTVATTQATAAGGGGGGGGGGVKPSGLEGADWSPGFAFGAAFLAGLLFNVMPCVLPVLPLKAAGFYRAAEHRRSRSFLLGVAFSAGIVLVFTVLAVFVLVLRTFTWGELFSNPWFVWSIVAVLILCAFGLFGAFTLNLPTSLYAVDPRQDTVGGNVIFGAFTAILATPCTAPLLPPLLFWASTQRPTIGVPAMMMVGVGMAFPYLLLSATPELARKFPRTGPWSELFKQMMGFMLLAAAAYFGGGRLIEGPEFWWLVVAVVAAAALYLMARTVQLTDNARPVGISAALAVVMLGGSLWWTARITGLTAPTSGGAAATTAHLTPYSDERFRDARDGGKIVLVKFTANWCATCQVIEGTVFRDPVVWDAMTQRGVVGLKVDLTARNAPGKDLLLKLNPAGGIPLTAIYAAGTDQPTLLASIYTSDDLLAALRKLDKPAQASAATGRP